MGYAGAEEEEEEEEEEAGAVLRARLEKAVLLNEPAGRLRCSRRLMFVGAFVKRHVDELLHLQTPICHD